MTFFPHRKDSVVHIKPIIFFMVNHRSLLIDCPVLHFLVTQCNTIISSVNLCSPQLNLFKHSLTKEVFHLNVKKPILKTIYLTLEMGLHNCLFLFQRKVRRQYFNNISMDNSKSKVRNSEIKCAIRKKTGKKKEHSHFTLFRVTRWKSVFTDSWQTSLGTWV